MIGTANLKPMRGSYIQPGHPWAAWLVYAILHNEGCGERVYDTGPRRYEGQLDHSTSESFFTTGRFGYGVGMGDDSYVYFYHPEHIDDFDLGGTVVFWIKFNSFDDGAGILNLGLTNDESALYIHYWDTGKISISIHNSGSGRLAEQFSATNSVTTGVWYQIAATWSNSTHSCLLYIDGTPVGSPESYSITASAQTDSDILRYGYSVTYFQGVTGIYDHMMVFNAPMTESDIARLYADPFCMYDRRDSLHRIADTELPELPANLPFVRCNHLIGAA